MVGRRTAAGLAGLVFLLAALPLLLAGGTERGMGWPEGEGSRPGWTGEQTLAPQGSNLPDEVQMATAGGKLYLVFSELETSEYRPADVRFSRSTDGGVSWTTPITLDWNASERAGHPRIAAWSSGGSDYVAVSFEEKDPTTEKYYLMVAFSANGGSTWTKWRDNNPACNNHQASLVFSGGKVHGAYVSDGSGQDEVYYRRWSATGTLEVDWRRASDDGGEPDTQPCLEVNPSNLNNVSIYYVHGGNSSDKSIYQSYTSDAGSTWTRVERIPDQHPGGWPDMDSPHVTRFMADGSRVMLVCQEVDYYGESSMWLTRYVSGVGGGSPTSSTTPIMVLVRQETPRYAAEATTCSWRTTVFWKELGVFLTA